MSASTHLSIGRRDGGAPDLDEVTRLLEIDWGVGPTSGTRSGRAAVPMQAVQAPLRGGPQPVGGDEELADIATAWPLWIANDDRDSARRLRWCRAAFEKLREAGGYAVALEDDTMGELDRFPAGVGPAL